jgi:acetylcholinesterase
MLDYTIVPGIAEWPKYGEGYEHVPGHTAPSNFVFRADKSYIEADDYRVEGMAYINSIPR